ncbi:twin-arginine translocase TatA/TatE family subunit [Magnetovibrio sp. PR-2]|uniref:twin-arginine translocase TatA/TatE family subunit n=1 Tax=Magnetovibrio sp. PR-2 TaxID=3120356 RepID=UPI002FCE2FE1
MGVMGIWQWVIVLAIVLLLFGGRGKISALMGDFGKGLKSFKKGMKDGEAAEDDANTAKTEAIEEKPAETVDAKAEDKDKAS